MESFFHTLKIELVHQPKWATREEAKRDLFAYIEAYYNGARIHSSIGYMTPEQAERMASQLCGSIDSGKDQSISCLSIQHESRGARCSLLCRGAPAPQAPDRAHKEYASAQLGPLPSKAT